MARNLDLTDANGERSSRSCLQEGRPAANGRPDDGRGNLAQFAHRMPMARTSAELWERKQPDEPVHSMEK